MQMKETVLVLYRVNWTERMKRKKNIEEISIRSLEVTGKVDKIVKFPINERISGYL